MKYCKKHKRNFEPLDTWYVGPDGGEVRNDEPEWICKECYEALVERVIEE